MRVRGHQISESHGRPDAPAGRQWAAPGAKGAASFPCPAVAAAGGASRDLSRPVFSFELCTVFAISGSDSASEVRKPLAITSVTFKPQSKRSDRRLRGQTHTAGCWNLPRLTQGAPVGRGLPYESQHESDHHLRAGEHCLDGAECSTEDVLTGGRGHEGEGDDRRGDLEEREGQERRVRVQTEARGRRAIANGAGGSLYGLELDRCRRVGSTDRRLVRGRGGAARCEQHQRGSEAQQRQRDEQRSHPRDARDEGERQ
eukprot:239809-Prymnesium_polylepis.2